MFVTKKLGCCYKLNRLFAAKSRDVPFECVKNKTNVLLIHIPINLIIPSQSVGE